MKRVRVKSSNIASVGYDAEALSLEVEFIGGAVYRYAGVSAKMHSALMGAESIGTSFHKLVRPNFKAELMPDAGPPAKRDEVVTQCGEHAIAKSSPRSHIKAHRVVRVRR